MEEHVITVKIRTKGEECELDDGQIKEWYEKNISKLFDPKYGTPEITVELERRKLS